MDKASLLNKKYQLLCQQLGDAHYKLKQLTEHIESLESQIENLNQCFPLLNELDAAAAEDK